MPRPSSKEPFESQRLKIRQGKLAQTRRIRSGEDNGPLEPDEIFEFDAARDHEEATENPVHERASREPARYNLDDPSAE